MDTSNNLTSFSVMELRTSGFPDEAALAEKAEQILWGLVDQLKPVLRYIANPIPIIAGVAGPPGCKDIVNPFDPEYYQGLSERAVELGKNPKSTLSSILFLGEDGEFFTAEECPFAPKNSRHFHYKKSWGDLRKIVLYDKWVGSWDEYPFDYLIAHLQAAFHKAKEKREKHLASIAERSSKLDQIMEILKKPTVSNRL